jgi:hypothetical protein
MFSQSEMYRRMAAFERRYSSPKSYTVRYYESMARYWEGLEASPQNS